MKKNLEYELSFVIPLYNSADTIGDVIDAIECIDVEGGKEIVLVNDGSGDETCTVVEKIAARSKVPITLIDHSRNYGEHCAVLTGLRHISGRFVVTLDDDMQNPPEEAYKLYLETKRGDYDVVYSYYLRKMHQGWRNIGSRFTNWTAEFLLEKPAGLYLSSFRCMNHFLASTIARFDGPFLYIDGLILQTTRNIGTLQVSHCERGKGESGYNLRRLVRLWLSMFTSF